jgi:hypothetical protein
MYAATADAPLNVTVGPRNGPHGLFEMFDYSV